MVERPLLNLPEPSLTEPRRQGGGGGSIARPSRSRQGARLEPKFRRLNRVANDPASLLALRADPSSIAPERAIVFEVEGTLEDFYKQAIELGLDYLGDFEDEAAPDADFYSTKDPAKNLTTRVYIAMPDIRALQELLSLWGIYRSGRRMPSGRGDWSKLFNGLIDVRPWGPQDRLSEETIAALEEELEADTDGEIKIEFELWYYSDAEKRETSYRNISRIIEESGGSIVSRVSIGEIMYHALLVNLPPSAVQDLVDNPDVGLARIDDVMFLRPQSVVSVDHERPRTTTGPTPDQSPATGEPIAALLDGYPVQNHTYLAGRLRIDDPEGLGDSYPVAQRFHGTEMASLIVWGDINHDNAPIDLPLYVRPILQPSGNLERTSPDKLLVDVIHEAVLRLKIGYGDAEAAAPETIIVNLSIGDPHRPFARVMSPLAKLLDYLSYQYKILFLVSAGNMLDRIKVEGFTSWSAFEAASLQDRDRALFHSFNAAKSSRTLLSPAESINALTIGASHSGSAYTGAFPSDRLESLLDENGPNIISAVGLGHKRGIKPEILLSGGRAPVMMAASGGELWVRPPQRGAQQFGIKAASPSDTGAQNKLGFTWGTSVATALATRAAHDIYSSLNDTIQEGRHDEIDDEFWPLVLKALLVHGAKWGDCGQMLDGLFPPQGQGSHSQRRDDITRLMGYGVPDIQRVLDCTENRATLLGTGQIESDTALLYRVPLPPGLEGIRAVRSLVITVAWMSPINLRHQGYRRAALDVSTASDDKWWIAEDRLSCQPTNHAVVRGTVLHEHRTGEAASVFVDDGQILFRIGCKAVAGGLFEPVPYAVAISFEVAESAGVLVYEEIKAEVEAIKAGVPVRAR